MPQHAPAVAGSSTWRRRARVREAITNSLGRLSKTIRSFWLKFQPEASAAFPRRTKSRKAEYENPFSYPNSSKTTSLMWTLRASERFWLIQYVFQSSPESTSLLRATHPLSYFGFSSLKLDHSVAGVRNGSLTQRAGIWGFDCRQNFATEHEYFIVLISLLAT